MRKADRLVITLRKKYFWRLRREGKKHFKIFWSMLCDFKVSCEVEAAFELLLPVLQRNVSSQKHLAQYFVKAGGIKYSCCLLDGVVCGLAV